MSWTPEKTNKLVMLWGKGDSASVIAKKIGGVSRNAVIGKIHRLGVAGRDVKAVSAQTGGEAPRRSATVKKSYSDGVKLKNLRPTKKTLAKTDPSRIFARPVATKKQSGLSFAAMSEEIRRRKAFPQKTLSLLELQEHSCRWPIGDPKEPGFGFCGADTGGKHSYCAEHTLCAYSSGGKKNRNKPNPDTTYFGRKSALKALNFI